MIFFDKNHHPVNGIQGVVKTIHKFMPKGVLFSKVFLIPKIEQDKIESLPFSYQFAAQSISNGLLRDDHETVSNADPSKVLSI